MILQRVAVFDMYQSILGNLKVVVPYVFGLQIILHTFGSLGLHVGYYSGQNDANFSVNSH